MKKSRIMPCDTNRVSDYLRELETNESPGTIILSTRTHVTAVKIMPSPDQSIDLDANSLSGGSIRNKMGIIISNGINYRRKNGDVFRVHGFKSNSSVPPSPR